MEKCQKEGNYFALPLQIRLHINVGMEKVYLKQRRVWFCIQDVSLWVSKTQTMCIRSSDFVHMRGSRTHSISLEEYVLLIR